MKTNFFDCQCHSAEHTIRFDFDSEDGELYITAYLKTHDPWYKRIWVAIKYIFGSSSSSKYGDFDCFIMQPQDRFRFADIAGEFKKYHEGK